MHIIPITTRNTIIYHSHSTTYYTVVLSYLNRNKYYNIQFIFLLLVLVLNLVIVVITTAFQPVLIILPRFGYSCNIGTDHCSIDIKHSWSQQQQQQQQTQYKRYCNYFQTLTKMKRCSSMIQNTKIDENESDILSQQQVGGEEPQSLPVSKRMKLMPTIRDFVSSSIIPIDLTKSYQERKENAIQNIQFDIASMQDQIRTMVPFTTHEKLIITNSLLNVIPNSESNNTNIGSSNNNNMLNMIEQLKNHILLNYAHLSHKNWMITDINSKIWHEYLYPYSSYIIKQTRTTTQETKHDTHDTTSTTIQRHMFERIYREGNWDGAVQYQQNTKQNKPWAVLVTGVNGIRKTTSIYQPWFPLVLQEALQSPTNTNQDNDHDTVALDVANLPCGSNTFFRQLDHIIATLCNEQFIRLYTYMRDMLVDIPSTTTTSSSSTIVHEPTSDIIQLYSNMKAAIFSRYRTISELLGVILLREAQTIPINCMVETSGRDVAMFHYIDHFFSNVTYHKLALHFTINDLQYAKSSVDQRMVNEIVSGIHALEQDSIFNIINTNVGGPYGSEVLDDIQADSDRVWKENIMAEDCDVGQDWYKATIQINAHPTKPWTAQAIKPDGTLGTEFTFER